MRHQHHLPYETKSYHAVVFIPTGMYVSSFIEKPTEQHILSWYLQGRSWVIRLSYSKCIIFCLEAVSRWTESWCHWFFQGADTLAMQWQLELNCELHSYSTVPKFLTIKRCLPWSSLSFSLMLSPSKSVATAQSCRVLGDGVELSWESPQMHKVESVRCEGELYSASIRANT